MDVRTHADAKGPLRRSGAWYGWRGWGPNNTGAVAGERADAYRSPLSPLDLLVGAYESQAQRAFMKIWKLKAA